MELYIDRANLLSFLKITESQQYKDDVEYRCSYDDCYRMLKRQLHVNYNFSEEEVKSLAEDHDGALLKFYFKESTYGVGDMEEKPSYIPTSFPPRPIKSDVDKILKNFQHSSVFLVDAEEIDAFKDKGTALIGKLGTELETFKRLFCGRDYDFGKLYNIQDIEKFSGWEQINKDKLNLPLSDIIIMDRYIGSQEQLFKYNLFKLVEILVRNVRGVVNIVLFAEHKVYDKVMKKDYTPNWDFLIEQLKNKLEKKTKVNGNVTLVLYPPKWPDNPHDRTIFTNYMMYRSGDSFCYYDSAGNLITNGKSFDANSLAKNENFLFAKSFIDDAQSIYNNIKKGYSYLIKGDKISNYIKF